MRCLVLCACVAVVVVLIPASALAADFNVTVGSDAGGFRWNINGVLNPTLTLTRGTTYTFAVNAPGHPFDIKTAQVTGMGSQFNTGVVGQGATNGTLTFSVPLDPTTPPLFYQCEVHGTMTGSLQLVAPPPTPAGGPLAFGLLALALGAGGFIALRMRARAT